MVNKQWHKIYRKYGLDSLPHLNTFVHILVDKDTVFKAKLVEDDMPCMTLDEQYYWSIENLGEFSLIAPDYWSEI